MVEEVDFSPAQDPPTLKRFAKSDAWIRVVVGPVGSGKSTRCVREIIRRALRQRRGPDGIRRSRFAVIRNTYGQLRDTTRKTFEQWVPAWMGEWHEQSFTFHIRFDDVDCEVLFRALDRPEDVRKLLSLELTGAYINELREIPERVLDVLETRVSRYPSKTQGGPSWSGIWADTNPWHGGHWGAKRFAKGLEGHAIFRQPSGRSPEAENRDKLPDPNYYTRLCVGKSAEYIKVYVDGEDADADEGAIFGAWIAALRKRGGVRAFDHATDDIFTTWDLGHSDATGIWFWRIARWVEERVGQKVVTLPVPDVVDHYENASQGLSHYFGIVDGKPYRYVKHWLPDDAVAKTLATQQSVFDQCVAHWGPDRVALVPSSRVTIQDGIEAARWLLEQPMLFHERCDVPGRFEHSGLNALEEYRFEWDEETQCFSRTPIHNWASHTASSFRYVALVVKAADLLTRKPKPEPKGPYAVPVNKSITLERLYEEQPKGSGRI